MNRNRVGESRRRSHVGCARSTGRRAIAARVTGSCRRTRPCLRTRPCRRTWPRSSGPRTSPKPALPQTVKSSAAAVLACTVIGSFLPAQALPRRRVPAACADPVAAELADHEPRGLPAAVSGLDRRQPVAVVRNVGLGLLPAAAVAKTLAATASRWRSCIEKGRAVGRGASGARLSRTSAPAPSPAAGTAPSGTSAGTARS